MKLRSGLQIGKSTKRLQEKVKAKIESKSNVEDCEKSKIQKKVKGGIEKKDNVNGKCKCNVKDESVK